MDASPAGGLVDKHLEAKLSGAGEAVADLVKGEGGDFDCPQRLVDLCAADTAVAATPCCVCYSTDTVGGNSGSPVLDANGDFVAINFDRQRLGLMNEFMWSAEYSRSIGAPSGGTLPAARRTRRTTCPRHVRDMPSQAPTCGTSCCSSASTTARSGLSTRWSAERICCGGGTRFWQAGPMSDYP